MATKPPSGSAATWYSVSPRLKLNSLGPKPMENLSTFTPAHLAAKKWPASCTVTSTPRKTMK